MQEPTRRRRRQATSRELLTGPRVAATSLVLLGLAIGLAAGLYYAWIVDPVVYVDASPARLDDEDKAEYIFLVSQSFATDGNWERAQRRLEALDDPELEATLNELLESYLRQRRSPEVVRNLAELAQQAGVEGSAVALFAPTPLPGAVAPSATPSIAAVAEATVPATATALPTNTPLPTSTPFPTLPPTATPQPIYRLLNQQRLCEANEAAPRIEVITYDALLNELSGVEVIVNWQEGQDRFFTGFKPEFGPGYGDFTMAADVSYAVILADGSPEISGLRIQPCASGFDGGWRLSFQNLRVAFTPTPTPDS